jgi:predicted nucleic acid-binding protein
MIKILDASALMRYLEKDSGYEKVRDLFVHAAENDKRLLMTTVNWGEINYLLLRSSGGQVTTEILKLIETLPMEVISVDLPLAKQAAFYKATKKLPYVDCFAAALTKLHKGELVTADNDFRGLEQEISIMWI